MPAYTAEDDAAAPIPLTLIEVFQQTYGVAGVPVKPVGPVSVTELPARCGVATSIALAAPGTGENVPISVLERDPRRKRVVLICDQDWIYSRKPSDKHGAPWPKSVPLVLEHCDDILARAQSTAGTLTVIVENWAD
jgi:hypothetical protein